MTEMRVSFETGGVASHRRLGVVDGYVHVSHAHPDNPNIYAIVIDDLTGTFVAQPLWKITALARKDRR